MFPHARALSLFFCTGAMLLYECLPARGTEILHAPQTQPAASANVESLLPNSHSPIIYRANLCPTVMTLGKDVANIAKQHIGIRYRSGGASPKAGFDCSGFVYWVFSQYGITLPRDSVRQSRAGHEVARADILPGDIIIFRIANTPNGRHSAIYIGDGSFIHSPSNGSSVRIEKLSAAYWNSHYLTARRVLKAPPCDTDISIPINAMAGDIENMDS